MSLGAESAAQLGIYAQLAVGFAGFAGVIGAFSRFRMHAEATAFRVRAMVVLAMMEALFALLPPLVAGFGVEETAAWRGCGALLCVGSAVAVTIMARQASRLYRQGRMLRWVAYIMSVLAVGLILTLAGGVAGLVAAPVSALYFALMFFGIAVCAYHFIMLMVAVQLDDSEWVDVRTSAPAASPARAAAASTSPPDSPSAA